MSHEADLTRQMEELERLIREMEEGPETPARARARRIVQAVLAMHGEALRRLLETVASHPGAGAALVERFGRDPVIAGTLLLHGLHPADVPTRVQRALDASEPMLHDQGARVVAVDITDTAVRVRFEREPGRGGLASEALRARLEAAIVAAAPELSTIEIEAPAEVGAFVPVDQVRMRRRVAAPHGG